MGFVFHLGCVINAESILHRSHFCIDHLFKHYPLKWVMTTICKLIQIPLFLFRNKSISCIIFHVNNVTSIVSNCINPKRAVHLQVMRCEWCMGSEDASLANDVVSTLNERELRWINVATTSGDSGNSLGENTWIGLMWPDRGEVRDKAWRVIHSFLWKRLRLGRLRHFLQIRM